MSKKKIEKVKKEIIEQPKIKSNKEKIKSVDQITIARLVAHRTGLSLTEVQQVIELEQKFTMDFIKRNRKVIKKNYLTLTPIIVKGKKFVSPLDGKEYELTSKRRVSVKIGSGFKSYICDNGKKMPEKICRFVDGSNTLEDVTE